MERCSVVVHPGVYGEISKESSIWAAHLISLHCWAAQRRDEQVRKAARSAFNNFKREPIWP